MKIPRLLPLFLMACSWCRADSLGDAAQFAVPKGWVAVSPSDLGAPPLGFPTVGYSPKDQRNERVMMTVFPAAAVHVSDRVSLKALLMRASTPMLPSPDFVPAIKNLEIEGSIGAYASFVDPSLVGKPPERNNFKVATPVIVLLPNGYVVQSTVFTDTVAGADFDEALNLVRSLTPLQPKPQAAPAAGEVSVPGLDAKLRLPAGQFSRSRDALNPSANYFSFINVEGVILSGWLDHASQFPGMAPFWAREKAAQVKGGFVIKSEMAMKVGGWDAVLYVVPLRPGIEQKNIRACRIVGATWADVHLSRTAQDSTFRDLEDALRLVDLVAAGTDSVPVGQ